MGGVIQRRILSLSEEKGADDLEIFCKVIYWDVGIVALFYMFFLYPI